MIRFVISKFFLAFETIAYDKLYVTKPVFGREIGGLYGVMITRLFVIVNPFFLGGSSHYLLHSLEVIPLNFDI